MWRALFICGILGTTCCMAASLNMDGGSKADGGSLSTDEFPYATTLDADQNFHLQWNFNASHIIFQARVKTTGYIGFGLSAHGSMYPSDVVIAWIKDGQVHFSDRHATGHVMPEVDAHQDWHLVSGSENGQYTIVTMIRKLDTCDTEDMVITSGTTKLIYSYSPTDPASDAVIHYHGNTRGTKSVLLLDPSADSDKNAAPLPDDVRSMDFVQSNYSVPSKDTTYACKILKLPPLKGKHHMIRYEPIIQKGHENLVHHMVVHTCVSDMKEADLGPEFVCYQDASKYHLIKKCYNGVFLAWAVGGTAFNYPDHVGYSLGDSGDPVYLRLEMHYDNPAMRDDFVDSSGFRLYVTQQIRQHDAGSLSVGVNVDMYQVIPPYLEHFVSRGTCTESCIARALGDDGEIHVFADFLHAHLLGRKLRTRHIRNGTELPPIMEDNNYDFNFQETRMLPQERTVKKGDSLISECVYDSSQRTFITYGGESTREEMCISYLLYYPKINLARCKTRPLYDVPDQAAFLKQVPQMDFTNKTVRDGFSALIQDKVEALCQIGREYKFVEQTPAAFQPYDPPSQCTNNVDTDRSRRLRTDTDTVDDVVTSSKKNDDHNNSAVFSPTPFVYYLAFNFINWILKTA